MAGCYGKKIIQLILR